MIFRNEKSAFVTKRTLGKRAILMVFFREFFSQFPRWREGVF